MWTYNYTDELYHYGVRKEYKPHPRKPSKKKEEDPEAKAARKAKIKKAVKIGAAVAATALVAYGGYKLYQNRYDIATRIADRIGDDDRYVETPIGSLPKIKKPLPIEKDIKHINPKFSMHNSDYNSNCGNCAIAFEMRRRGFDVKALGNPNGMNNSNIGEFFSGLNSKSFIQMTPRFVDHQF